MAWDEIKGAYMYKLYETLGNFTASRAQELAPLEDENMAVIEKVYQHPDFKRLPTHIELISCHRWSDLHYTAQPEASLTALKAQELAAFEGANKDIF